MHAGSPLLGTLRLRPGVALPDGIRGGRPDLAGVLLRGQTSEVAVERVALLHTLCAMAHRLVAQRAVAVAITGVDQPLASGQLAALAADIAREHARRIGHDWPLAWGQPSQAPALSRLPRQADAAALGDWLAREWLGVTPAQWLRQASDADGEIGLDRAIAALQRSAQARPDGIAATLAQALHLSRALPFEPGPAVEPLRPEQPDQARALGQAMAEAGYTRAPHWRGGVPDTGPWNRLARSATPKPAGLPQRLLARWTELLSLALPAGGWRPAHGAVALGPHQALAWVETARGLLAHRVSLDRPGADAVMADWQVLAPTEWNFHPRGTLARALAALPADTASNAEVARGMACAYDPCMACEIETLVTKRIGDAARPCMS
ncbi:nickel-dependent hydrogenase large subunit [Leptothrix discophora]|uniref:Nickel-dependent hydrogenase large subunit n=1 Tax=Leptothrix discophora TaxID=89 RepID=A0ABT9G1X7_LEPDI|nr:nickel-dependent hydrogenase large subunit [Leptothrix discophora]MDP4300287.1 nickel-dependent hydrogenase large subunit [Leptothrix discophora]